MSDTTTPPKSIKGTKTEANLATAYVSESIAYTRYTYYSQQAQKEQYYQYANIFAETADNELHHGKIYLKYLTDGAEMSKPLSVDSGVLSSTLNNLATAAEEEQNEGVNEYIAAAKVADEEGFPEIAARFRAIASIEAHHEARFRKMHQRIVDGTVWKRESPIKWQCLVCGYIYEGTTPPAKCPACYHPYQHFQPLEASDL